MVIFDRLAPNGHFGVGAWNRLLQLLAECRAIPMQSVEGAASVFAMLASGPSQSRIGFDKLAFILMDQNQPLFVSKSLLRKVAKVLLSTTC